MRQIISTLMVFLAVGSLAKAQNANANTSDGIPFHISSFNSPFAMQGNFEGEYRVYPNRIEIRVTKADIRISDHCPYKGRRLLSAVGFSLATSIDDRKWKPVYHGQRHLLELVMTPSDTASLGELYFNIPIDETIDLSKYWFVVQMSDTTLDVPIAEREVGYAFAHSSRDIFRLPVK
jgi:hypothetical protein